MDKKKYTAPSVKKVRLEIKNAVLTVCHTSTISSPKDDFGCKFNPTCSTNG